MTSQSSRRSLQRGLSEEREIVINGSSSEDEDETLYHFGLRSSVDGRSIRELILEGKRLLALAERKSQPEEYRNEGASVYRYDFSSAVTGRDLFRERELAELLTVASVLKTRLSAERVFSLGCPQLRSERDVFDELLMRFSEEVLDVGLSARAESTISAEAANLRLDRNDRIASTSTSSSPTSSENPSVVETPGAVLRPTELSSSVQQPAQQEDNVNEVENSDTAPDSDRRNAGGSGSSTDTTTQLHNNVSLPTVQGFLQHLNDLNTLTTTMASDVVVEKFSEPSMVSRFQALQQYLSALLSSSPTPLPMPQQPYTSPRQRKRRRSEENDEDDAAKKPKAKTEEIREQEEDDEDSCSICLEPWTTGGEHRITCLKCGHLFGLSCILKWVEQAHSCPQCKVPAKKNDLRNIFVRKITAEDTSQRDRAVRLLEEEKVARRNLEQKEAMARKKLDIQMADNELLRTELNRLKSQPLENGGLPVPHFPGPPPSSNSQTSNQATSKKQYRQMNRINIAADGSCRVFDCCRESGMMVVSQRSPNALFRGFGIKILARDLRPLSYQPLHSATIRDMSFRPGSVDGMLLSCGMDKCVQLTSVTSKVVIQKYTVNNMVWCCTWNTQNTNLFYAGMERGVVKEFDIRKTDSHVQDVLDNGGSPITSIQYWKGSEHGDSNFRGLLISQLQNLIFKEEVNNNQYTTHLLPHRQASLMSLSLHPSGNFLASFRPGINIPTCRYEICTLCQSNAGSEERTITSSRQAVWEGGNVQAVISRNSLISQPESDGDLLAITANHSNNTVNVWDYNRKQDFQTLNCYDKAIDIKSVMLNRGSEDVLGVLTDKDLMLYKWTL